MADGGSLTRYGVDYTEAPQDGAFLLDASGDDLSNDIVIPETPIDLKLTVSIGQYTKMLSALLNGAYRYFPDEVFDVIYPLIKAGKELATVSCEDVADCIDTNEGTRASIQNLLIDNGYTQNFGAGSDPVIVVTDSEADRNLIPASAGCADGTLMAIARGIVRELNESTVDLLQQIELITNPSELGADVVDNIPVLGAIPATILEFGNWLQDSFQEIYEASYTDAVEDEIACSIFCEMQSDCTLTLNRLISVYTGLFDGDTPADLSDVGVIIEWIMDIPLSAGVGLVAAYQYGLLLLLRFGGGIANFVGIGDLEETIATNSGLIDNSYYECDCAPVQTPEAYWVIYQDLSVGLGDWIIAQGEKVAGGVRSLTYSGQSRVLTRIVDLEDAYNIKAAAVEVQRRGSNGNGSNDFHRVSAYQNTNNGGSEYLVANQSFITCNTNSCKTSNVLVTPTSASQSLRVAIGVDGASSYPSNFAVLRKVAFYGLCNGTDKPPQAVYIDAIPADLLDPYA